MMIQSVKFIFLPSHNEWVGTDHIVRIKIGTNEVELFLTQGYFHLLEEHAVDFVKRYLTPSLLERKIL